MTEYIDREAAYQTLTEYYHHTTEGMHSALREAISRVPAADVREVKRGKWYWDKDGMDWGIGSWRCSECHARPETWWQGDSTNPRNKSGHYFCPNCGADMR